MTTVVLDVNETLFGLDPVADALAAVGLDGALPELFARVLRDGFAVAAMGRFAAFPDVARHHVAAMVAARPATGPGEAAADAVVAAFDEVGLHDDVAPGLQHLRDAGARVVAFTNGTAGIARGALERGGVADLVDDVRDVSEVGAWKPSGAAYAWIADATGSAPQDCTLVAVHPWDVAGAMRAGFTGAWLDRAGGEPWPDFLAAPHVRATSFDALARAVVA